MITIIHNLYKLNHHVRETVILNLYALENSGIDYQYICFNDNGNKEIYNDINDINNIEYIYSDINYGRRMCTGGWVGAIPYIKGDIVHNIGQDDVITSSFYTKIKEEFQDNDELDFYTNNGFRVDENLNFIEFLSNPYQIIDYGKPLEMFKQWFGIQENKLTCAHNYMLATGTVYKIRLHDQIGPPDVNKYVGASDFEYWARMLFYEKKGIHDPLPRWYYRMSKYSSGYDVIDGKPNRGYWQEKAIKDIHEKYQKLWEER